MLTNNLILSNPHLIKKTFISIQKLNSLYTNISKVFSDISKADIISTATFGNP